MKVFSANFFFILTVLAISGIAASCQRTMKDGVYQGNAAGHNGPLVMEVTVDGGRVTEITAVSHNETEGIAAIAFDRVPRAIIDGQTLAVDAVAGATVSSYAIMSAVAGALGQAGGNIAALRKSGPRPVVSRALESRAADIVVIGAGGAGLAAAISASQNGARVIVLEKMPQPGGNTIRSGAAYNAADPRRQAALEMNQASHDAIMALTSKAPYDRHEAEWQRTVLRQYDAFVAARMPGMFDSPEWHALQTYNGGDYIANPAVVKTLADNALAALEWHEGNGMEFTGMIWTVLGGLWPRAHKPVMPLGTGYITASVKYIEAHRDTITLIVDTKATELIMTNGRVTGVKASSPTADYEITAAKAVIIATGGFGASKEMRQRYNTQWPNLDNAQTTNHPGATGDGISLAEKAGAGFTGMEWIQLLPMGDPKTGSLSGNIEQGVEDRFFVNKNGDRFVDEGAHRDVMSIALFNQPDAWMWVICDSQSYPAPQTRNNFNESIEELIAQGRAFEGNTIEELASRIKVPAANLKAALDEFNAGFDAKRDKWGRTLWRIKIDQPPYYAGARVPTVHHTMGGIQINARAQVLNAAGEVIPGLYAAGEVTGGIHGSNRLGGNALADIHVFGRIAGAAAAGE